MDFEDLGFPFILRDGKKVDSISSRKELSKVGTFPDPTTIRKQELASSGLRNTLVSIEETEEMETFAENFIAQIDAVLFISKALAKEYLFQGVRAMRVK